MNESSDAVRLNKYLAESQGLSRRQVDEMIADGRVVVNGKPAVLGVRIIPLTDMVAIDDRPVDVASPTAFTYLLLNKPIGYVCSRRAQGDTPTIYSLLPEKYHSLKPVGRLDKDSSGILLLTNDGDFAHQMTHPKFAKVKMYHVSLSQPLRPLHHQMINDHGIQLEDGGSKLTLERMNQGDDKNWLVTMSEGRNRQIRRTFAALGYNVNSLHRIQFGPYQLNDMQPGKTKLVART
ncbi:MAG TPA: pseudouridine synthase [Candidatus Saccharimonadales bacterium]|jgi:23S rRNA pseudouridine2605 synthase|nr:pseudouridine synthase [Candidatus Saccharimonadales bacterium]